MIDLLIALATHIHAVLAYRAGTLHRSRIDVALDAALVHQELYRR